MDLETVAVAKALVSSSVDGFGGRLRSSMDDEFSELMAKLRNSADLVLTHNVHRNSDNRVR